MGCEICGSNVKNPKTTSHINSRKHQIALGNSPPKKVKSKSSAHLTILEDRIKTLEKQMMSVLQRLEIDTDHNLSDDDLISNHLLLMKMLPSTGSIVVDVLFNNVKHLYSFRAVEKALLKLLDEEKINLSPGNSKIKIKGQFGRITVR